MVDIYFTRIEANQKLGRKVRSVAALGPVPEGTQRTVVKVIRSHANQWSIRVRWQMPRLISLIDAAELSFFRREKPTVSDLSKSVYEKFIEEVN